MTSGGGSQAAWLGSLLETGVERPDTVTFASGRDALAPLMIGSVGASAEPEPVFAPRELALPAGETLTIRPVTPADVDGLAALYDGLDLEDRFRRFFSGYRPSRTFLVKMATAADRGGFGLVAVAGGDDESAGRIVGEAGYVRLADGDGELAMTVADGWRGWLGPYLLDALLEVAATQGLPNLQADVLVTNRPMFALMRSRGYVAMDHPDAAVARIVVGTKGTTPTWPGPHDRPRVLVEVPGGRWHAEDEARAAGLQVLACPGPTGARTRCPALDGAPCPLAAGADAVVLSRPPDDPRWLAVRSAHQRLHPGVPVCVEPARGAGYARPSERRVPGGDDSVVVDFVQCLARQHRSEGHRGDRGEEWPQEALGRFTDINRRAPRR